MRSSRPWASQARFRVDAPSGSITPHRTSWSTAFVTAGFVRPDAATPTGTVRTGWGRKDIDHGPYGRVRPGRSVRAKSPSPIVLERANTIQVPGRERG